MTSNSLNYDDYLMHHGVKGMKWGVRKKPDKPQYSRYGRGIIGDKNYESDHTAGYRDMAKRYEYKSNKARYKASNSNKGSRIKARRLKKAEKFSNKAKKYNEYAERSAELDKKASAMARKIMPKSNSAIKKFVRDVIRDANEDRYQLKAAKISLGKQIFKANLYGEGWQSIARDDYVRKSVKRNRR